MHKKKQKSQEQHKSLISVRICVPGVYAEKLDIFFTRTEKRRIIETYVYDVYVNHCYLWPLFYGFFR